MRYRKEICKSLSPWPSEELLPEAALRCHLQLKLKDVPSLRSVGGVPLGWRGGEMEALR